MSKMHLSPSSSQTQTLPDVDLVFSPRNELLQLLQREQDEAMALLDSSPFLTGLIMKYTMGAMSKTSYDSLRKELEKAKEAYDLVVEEAEKSRTDRNKHSQELELLRKESEAQLEKALQEKEQLSKECKGLRDLLADTRDELHTAQSEIADMRVEHDASITKIRAERQEVEQRVTEELEKCHAEISVLKMRDKIFLDVITHQRASAMDIETLSPIKGIPSSPQKQVVYPISGTPPPPTLTRKGSCDTLMPSAIPTGEGAGKIKTKPIFPWDNSSDQIVKPVMQEAVVEGLALEFKILGDEKDCEKDKVEATDDEWAGWGTTKKRSKSSKAGKMPLHT